MSEIAAPIPEAAPRPAAKQRPERGEIIRRHTRIVRVTHWINLACITLLLFSGLQIFNAHPALYWGQYGADADRPFLSMQASLRPDGGLAGKTQLGPFTFDTTGLFGASDHQPRGFPAWLTLPASRNLAVGRRWHFFWAWVFVLNGLGYLAAGVVNGHFRRDLAPTREQLKPRNLWRDVVDHVRLKHPTGEAAKVYNPLQKFAYLSVIFVLLPLMALTGLTMSPGVDAAFPALLTLFGGRQSARSLHFITANLIVLFVFVHVFEVFLVGAANEIGSMITGRYTVPHEQKGGGH
jgi:thiosulfate reductase cytochrome b subunit